MKEKKRVRPALQAVEASMPGKSWGKPEREVIFAGSLYEKRGYVSKGELRVWIEADDRHEKKP